VEELLDDEPRNCTPEDEVFDSGYRREGMEDDNDNSVEDDSHG
jgi:hypothetical protein